MPSEQELEFLKRGLQQLAINPNEEVPAHFHATVMAKAREVPPPRKGWLRRVWEQPMIMMPALTTAIVLVLMLQAWELYRDFRAARVEAPQYARGTSQGKTAVQEAPPMAAIIQQGDYYVRVGDTARAIAIYQEAIDQVAHPLNQLAWLLHAQGRIAEGLPLARLAVQLRPDNAEYLDTLAVLLCKEGQTTEALQWMARAAERQPQQFRHKLHRLQQGECE